jgi:adenine-specific DNA-methyltransferase
MIAFASFLSYDWCKAGQKSPNEGRIMARERQAQAIGEQILLDELRDALAAHLYREARRLGLSFKASQATSLCDSLLRGPTSPPTTSQHPPGHILRESTLFDTYYTENLEVHDYLHLVSQEMRKRLGQYVTPSVIVKYILDAVGYREDTDILDRRLADPACGSGIFLVEAVRIYLAALRRAGTPIETWYPRVLSAFAGVDVDPVACLYARFNLSLLLTPAILFWAGAHPNAPLLPPPVHCLNTLRTVAMELGVPRLFSYETETPTLRLTGSFDFVIGNPPYHKIGRLDRELKDVFQASLYGHPNAYGLFLHAGLEMLRPTGILGYIVPRSMLSGLYFKNLRQFIERRTVLREITLIAERRKVFANVLQGTMILTLQRQPVPPSPFKTAIARSVTDLETQQMSSAQVSQEQVVRHLDGTSVWFVADTRRTYEILDKILSHPSLLSGPAVGCPARTGPIVWNRVKPLLRSGPDSDTLPLVWATDVGRFTFSFGSASESRPSYLKVTPRTHRLVNQGLSLLAQRVTADEQPHRLVACIPESFCTEHATGYFVENHLNVIQPRPDAPPIDLYYLLGVLCSDVIEFFFRAMNGNTQVSATELNLMPIPRCNREPQIAALARQLQNTPDPVARVSLERRLNEQVAEAYGLTPHELDFMW